MAVAALLVLYLLVHLAAQQDPLLGRKGSFRQLLATSAAVLVKAVASPVKPS